MVPPGATNVSTPAGRPASAQPDAGKRRGRSWYLAVAGIIALLAAVGTLVALAAAGSGSGGQDAASAAAAVPPPSNGNDSFAALFPTPTPTPTAVPTPTPTPAPTSTPFVVEVEIIKEVPVEVVKEVVVEKEVIVERVVVVTPTPAPFVAVPTPTPRPAPTAVPVAPAPTATPLPPPTPTLECGRRVEHFESDPPKYIEVSYVTRQEQSAETAAGIDINLAQEAQFEEISYLGAYIAWLDPGKQDKSFGWEQELGSKLGGPDLRTSKIQAQQVPGHAFLGTVTVNGQLVPTGTLVTAWIGGVVQGSTTVQAGGTYRLLVNQGSGTDITFKIGNLTAHQCASWEQGGATLLNLTN